MYDAGELYRRFIDPYGYALCFTDHYGYTLCFTDPYGYVLHFTDRELRDIIDY